jgi:hypothetical protein
MAVIPNSWGYLNKKAKRGEDAMRVSILLFTFLTNRYVVFRTYGAENNISVCYTIPTK